MRLSKSNTLFLVTLGTALLFLGVSTTATADLSTEICENSPDGVADDIVDLADDTRTVGMLGIWVRRGHVDPYAGERFAKKLDAEPQRPGKKRRGAATKLRQGEIEGALDKMDAYIAGVTKTKTVDDAAQAIADGLVDDAIFLIGCINSL
jgi:hypothetical protein